MSENAQQEPQQQQQENEEKPEDSKKVDKKKIAMEKRLQAAIDAGIQKADTNGDGKIDEEELLFLLTEINDDISDQFAKNLFFGIDVEHKKRVEFSQVRDLLELLKKYWCEIDEKNRYPVELLKVFFRAMDKDQSNTVNLQEMIDFMKSLDENLSTHASAIQLRKMDKDNSGQISFYEYCKSFGVDVQKKEDPYDGKGQSSCCLLI